MLNIVVKIVVGIIVAISIYFLIVVLKEKNDSLKEKKDSIKRIKGAFVLETFAVVLAALPFFVDVRLGDLVLYYGNAEELERMENNYAKAIRENANMKTTIEEKDDKILDLKTELEEEKENNKYSVDFLEYSLYSDGNKENINLADSIADINGNLYFSQEAVEELLGDKIIDDKEKKMFYIGKYPEEKVDLLDVCDPYDPEDGFELASENPFKIQAKNYSKGIKLSAYARKTRTVKFNLDKKYSELSFNIGHIDETNLENTFTLRIYVDRNLVKEIVCNATMDINQQQTVPLNKGNTMMFEWICDSVSDVWAEYGLVNLQLK